MQRLSIHRCLTPNLRVIVIVSRKVFDSSETGMSFSNAHKVSEVSRIQGFTPSNGSDLCVNAWREVVCAAKSDLRVAWPISNIKETCWEPPPLVFGAAVGMACLTTLIPIDGDIPGSLWTCCVNILFQYFFLFWSDVRSLPFEVSETAYSTVSDWRIENRGDTLTRNREKLKYCLNTLEPILRR